MRNKKGQFEKDPLARERLSAAEQIERLTAWNLELATRLVELEGKLWAYEILDKLEGMVRVDTYTST